MILCCCGCCCCCCSCCCCCGCCGCCGCCCCCGCCGCGCCRCSMMMMIQALCVRAKKKATHLISESQFRKINEWVEGTGSHANPKQGKAKKACERSLRERLETIGGGRKRSQQGWMNAKQNKQPQRFVVCLSSSFCGRTNHQKTLQCFVHKSDKAKLGVSVSFCLVLLLLLLLLS